MGLNRNKEGGSVYLDTSHEQRAYRPLRVATRRLIERFAPEHSFIIDLGCADLPTTGPLQDTYKIIGLDLDPQSLVEGKKRYPKAHMAVCSLPDIPLGKDNKHNVSAVVLLDILEHLSYEEANRTLTCLINSFPEAKLIVSMPIIEPTIPCVIEQTKILVQGKRPQKGLFDHTHLLLFDRKKQQALFNDSGYEIAEQYTTNYVDGITGSWDIDLKHRQTWKRRLVGLCTKQILPAIVHPFNTVKRNEFAEHIIAYQGLYVLTPSQERGG